MQKQHFTPDQFPKRESQYSLVEKWLGNPPFLAVQSLKKA
jgi:hypothetical protein